METKANPRVGVQQNEMRTWLTVENIKCEGCAKSINERLSEIGIKNVFVDPATNCVEMDSPPNREKLDEVIEALHSLGYPLVESEAGLRALALKARSYMSCAIGKIS